jgi:hypothetical protein
LGMSVWVFAWHSEIISFSTVPGKPRDNNVHRFEYKRTAQGVKYLYFELYHVTRVVSRLFVATSYWMLHEIWQMTVSDTITRPQSTQQWSKWDTFISAWRLLHHSLNESGHSSKWTRWQASQSTLHFYPTPESHTNSSTS